MHQVKSILVHTFLSSILILGTISAYAQAPTFTSVPANGTTGVNQADNIVLTFSEPMRGIPSNETLDDSNIDGRITLKIGNAGGSDIPFDATIDGTKTIVTINPTGNLPSLTVIYVNIINVEAISDDDDLVPAPFTFTVGDFTPPVSTFNPTNSTSNVAINSNIVISFDEDIFQADGSPIDAGAIQGGIVELKVTNDAGAAVPFTATFNGTNQITINPDADLTNNTIYYVELNPVEDSNGNETAQTTITFSTPDTVAPNFTFNITNGATGVLETTQIIITFNEPVRKIDDGVITSGDLNSLVELKFTDNTGAGVPFTAVINGPKTVVTVTPTGNLAGNTLYYVEMNPVEDESNNASTAASITFTTGDSLPPQVAFNPANSATNVSAVGNITLTFNEAIRKLDDSAITPADIQGGLVELKLTNNGGAAIPFTATINGTNTIITINPNSTLSHNQVYFVEINPVEDAAENVTTAQSITFTTEDRPSISGFLPAAGTCIGDNVTVNGSRFAGTGSPASGNTQPTVTVNGATIPPANIVSFNATQVVFTLPAGFSTGAITVRNNDSDLQSANSASNLNVFPAINTGLTVTPATFSPAQNTNVNIDVLSTQDNNYSYSLILTSAPGGYSLTPPATVHTLAGNNATRTLNTSEGPDPNLDVVGGYTYRIDVSRTGCTTRTLTNTPVTLTVASLAVSVSTTSATNSVCIGTPITLIGAASGGTGFYQFRWTASPTDPTLNTTSSSPSVSPTVNTQYTLEVEDNAGNIVTDLVNVIANPVPAVNFLPAGNSPTIVTEYTNQDELFELNASPTQLISGNAVFSGPGVVPVTAEDKYFFNPELAGNGVHEITYTYSNGTCSNETTIEFRVSSTFVDNLETEYCINAGLSDILTLSPIGSNYLTTYYPSYTFTRLRFLRYVYNPFIGIPTYNYYDPITQPSLEPLYNVALNQWRLDVDELVANHGIAPLFTNYYVVVFARDANKVANPAYVDEAVLYNFFRVVPLGTIPDITGIIESQNICSTTAPISLNQSLAGYTINSFSVNAPYSASISGNAFNPGHNSLTSSGLDEVTLAINLSYDDSNGCSNSTTKNINWVRKPNAPFASDVSFCQVTAPTSYKLSAQPNGSSDKPLWYEVDPAANPLATVIDSINFDLLVPGIDGTVDESEDFFVRQQYKGCRGDASEATITIKRAPDARFSPPNFCIDRPQTFTGPIDTLNSIPFSTYKWNLGDGTILTNNNNPSITHTFTAPSSNPIVLEVTNSLGCIRSELRNPIIGENPKPTFTHRLICEGNSTQFFGGVSEGLSAKQFQWDFNDNGTDIAPGDSALNVIAPNGGTFKRPTHQFIGTPGNSAGIYNVTLTTYTNLGCSNSITKPVVILDTMVRNTLNPYLMEEEEGGMGYWRLEDINGNSTWAFGIPSINKQKMSEITTPAWATGLSTNYNPLERSFLNSPCFNISAIDRPVISMNFVLDTDQNREGVALEFSKDGGITWLPVGGTNSGLNWFNTSGFGVGNIGSSPLGWSGGSWSLEDNPEADTLTEARRALDTNLNNLSQTDRENVRFRFAFATDDFVEFEGFAFNNLSITTRDKISLVENFTNNTASRYTNNNTVFQDIPSIVDSELAKIQYHVSFPASDAEYEVNTIDPLARAAYYGIPMTDQQIPRGYIDGISDGALIPINGTANLANWAATRFSKQSLKTSDFDVQVESLDAADDSYLKVRALVTAKTDIGAGKQPILHLAVVEKAVGANNVFVLRKLIPNAIGHALPISMQEDDFIEIIDSVRIEKPQIDVTELALVAFVQDVNTREVFQADLDLNPTFLPDQPTLVTGIEDLAEYINIYPNPANESFEIELPTKAENRLMVNLIDPVGRATQQLYFEKGEQTKTVNTQNLAQGIYVVQIGSGKTGVVRKKVMVVH